MKANSLLLFISAVILGSCFDSPEFSQIPRIRFESVYFGKARNEFKPDSLVIELSFEDGDGNLGLPDNYKEDPFHEQNFFIGENGNLTPVGKKTLAAGFPRLLNIPSGINGKLVVLNTRRNPVFTDKMVAYNSDSACLYYNRIDSVLLKTADKRFIDESYVSYDIPHSDPDDPGFTSVTVVKDTFYIEKNPNYHNIDVRFYRKAQDPGNPSTTKFVEVNWDKILCMEAFAARFPVLTDRKNPLSGKITYSMASTQLENVMGNFIWKLRIRIRDRALNVSNVVESREFTLDEIRR